MTTSEEITEVPQLTRLYDVEGETDACDVAVTNGPVVWLFHFSRILPQYGKLHALTGVEWLPVSEIAPRASFGLPMTPFSPVHVDWRSGSSMDSFERRVRSYFDRAKKLDIPWTQMMQFAVQRLNEFIFSAGDIKAAEWVEKIPPPEYIVYPIWPRSRRPVVWFGQGETAKGTTAIGATFSATYGQPFAGLRTREMSRGFVYVDYEDDFDEFSRRVSRYAAGLEMAPNGLLRHFDPHGRLFVDIVEQLKHKVAAIGGVDGYIIDSAIPACGGDVNKPEPVGAFFAALAELGKPTLIIAHETKEGNDGFPFGSQIWRTSPAMNVNFQAGEQSKDLAGHLGRDVLLRCTKANNVPRFRPLAFHVEFTDDEQPQAQGALGARPVQACTWIRQMAPTSVSLDLQEKLGTTQRLAAYLREATEPPTIKELMDATGLDRGTVYRALVRNPETFASEGGGRGRGKEATWTLIQGGAA